MPIHPRSHGGNVLIMQQSYTVILFVRHIKKTPIILGGIEASLRRLAHYDYWSDKLKRSILLDSGADLISYGMGERSIVEIAEALDSGIDIKDITFIDGTVCKVKSLDSVYDAILLPSYEELKKEKLNYAKVFIHNIAIPIPLQESEWQKRIVSTFVCCSESAVEAAYTG